ncbi:MAG: bifunctional hydroxymethylpyrimidine kinase/phosphomethylpyrimidine kinase [Deltaproteobacteria bacterium]|nr:bifunctional hydroxymethylpyrimidine kinase/phosphomethylpyrimidine kinase [Deltaproteobacteria bacterium]
MSDAVDVPVVLTIAGSDSSGGAGIQADLKTFAAHRCYGASAITAITAQNTMGVRAIHACPPDVVKAQIAAVIEDLPVRAAKTGMLVDKATILAVVEALAGASFALVVDPVLISKSGHALLQDDAVDVLLHRLVPLSALVTPNLPEAQRLSGCDVDDGGLRAAQVLLDRGARAVLIKGGHASGDDVVDMLFTRGQTRLFSSKRLKTRHTHGTGCTLSAAITALLAFGLSLDDAIEQAIAYVHTAIARAPGFGAGHGPLHHLHPFDRP